jgi:hypothetical protein
MQIHFDPLSLATIISHRNFSSSRIGACLALVHRSRAKILGALRVIHGPTTVDEFFWIIESERTTITSR